MTRTETGTSLINRFIQKPTELHLPCQPRKFPDLYSFLNLIDPRHPNNLKTVECYLFGNKLTKPYPKKDLIAQYQERVGVDIAAALDKILPETIYPTHFFQVAFIAAKDPGDPVVKINGCAIFPGKILSIDGNSAIVSRPVYPDFRNIEQQIELPSNHQFSINKIVALHLNSAFTIITPEQARNLDYWNRRVASLI